jgi:hypothetical protein
MFATVVRIFPMNAQGRGSMRWFYLLVLLAVVGVVVLFAFENLQEVPLQFLNQSVKSNVALVVGISYVLGMLSGWTVLGLLRRSFERVTTFEQRQPHANR